MKKLIFFLVLLLSFPVLAVCQTLDVNIDGAPLSGYYESLTALAALSVFITGRLKALFKFDKEKQRTRFLNQLVSWGSAFVILLPGLYFKWGIFENGMAWYDVLFYGLNVALVSNGVSSVGNWPYIKLGWEKVKSLYQALVQKKE